MKTIIENWRMLLAGFMASLIISLGLCLLGWFCVSLIETLMQGRPAKSKDITGFLLIPVLIGEGLGVLFFVPAMGIAMGGVAAWFWRKTTLTDALLYRACFLPSILVSIGGFYIFPTWWLLAFLPMTAILFGAMGRGVELGLYWWPRKPWLYFLGRTPYPPNDVDMK